MTREHDIRNLVNSIGQGSACCRSFEETPGSGHSQWDPLEMAYTNSKDHSDSGLGLPPDQWYGLRSKLHFHITKLKHLFQPLHNTTKLEICVLPPNIRSVNLILRRDLTLGNLQIFDGILKFGPVGKSCSLSSTDLFMEVHLGIFLETACIGRRIVAAFVKILWMHGMCRKRIVRIKSFSSDHAKWTKSKNVQSQRQWAEDLMMQLNSPSTSSCQSAEMCHSAGFGGYYPAALLGQE